MLPSDDSADRFLKVHRVHEQNFVDAAYITALMYDFQQILNAEHHSKDMQYDV